MVRHIVMFWLKQKDEATIREAVELINSMKGKIPGMLSLDAGADFAGSQRSCDLCLCETFESREALDVYQTHPVHMPIKTHMHAVMERSASADYEVPEA